MTPGAGERGQRVLRLNVASAQGSLADGGAERRQQMGVPIVRFGAAVDIDGPRVDAALRSV